MAHGLLVTGASDSEEDGEKGKHGQRQKERQRERERENEYTIPLRKPACAVRRPTVKQATRATTPGSSAGDRRVAAVVMALSRDVARVFRSCHMQVLGYSAYATLQREGGGEGERERERETQKQTRGASKGGRIGGDTV